MGNKIIGVLFVQACTTGETIGPIELQLINRYAFMPSVTVLMRPFAGLDGLTLLLFGTARQLNPVHAKAMRRHSILKRECGMD